MISTEKRGCNGWGKFRRMLTTTWGSVNAIIYGEFLNFPVIYSNFFIFHFHFECQKRTSNDQCSTLFSEQNIFPLIHRHIPNELVKPNTTFCLTPPFHNIFMSHSRLLKQLCGTDTTHPLNSIPLTKISFLMVTANFTICGLFECCSLYKENEKKKKEVTWYFGKKRGKNPIDQNADL